MENIKNLESIREPQNNHSKNSSEIQEKMKETERLDCDF